MCLALGLSGDTRDIFDRFVDLRLDWSEEEPPVIQKQACISCDEVLPKYFFPKSPTARCDHASNTCSVCWQDWLEAEVNSKDWESVSCAQSPAKLDHDAVRMLSKPVVFDL